MEKCHKKGNQAEKSAENIEHIMKHGMVVNVLCMKLMSIQLFNSSDQCQSDILMVAIRNTFLRLIYF